MIFRIVGPCVGLSHLSLWGCAAHLFVSFTAIHGDGRHIMVVCFLRVCVGATHLAEAEYHETRPKVKVKRTAMRTTVREARFDFLTFGLVS